MVRLALLSATTVLGAFSATASAATLVADYRFENSYANAPGLPAPAATSGASCGFASETIDGQERVVARFCPGQELVVPMQHTPSGGQYTIAALIRMSAVNGWKRMLDFRDGAIDPGLYVYGGRLAFYPGAMDPAAFFQPDRWRQVVISRDARTSLVTVYVDGSLRLSFRDSSAYATRGGTTARFFRDDTSEHGSGALARVRVWDGPLSAHEVASLSRLGSITGRITIDHAGEHQSRPVVRGSAEPLFTGSTPGTRNAPLDIEVGTSAGQLVEVGRIEAAQFDRAWEWRGFAALEPGRYVVRVSQTVQGELVASEARPLSVAAPAPTSTGRPDLRPPTRHPHTQWAVDRAAQAFGEWLRYQGEHELLRGIARHSFGLEALGRRVPWLSFYAPEPGMLYVRVGRLSQRRCCADVVSWANVPFPRPGRRAFPLAHRTSSFDLRQHSEYWFQLMFRPRSGGVVRADGEQSLTWRPECSAPPRGASRPPRCIVRDPCGAARRGPDFQQETCGEHRRRQRLLEDNRRRRAGARIPLRSAPATADGTKDTGHRHR